MVCIFQEGVYYEAGIPRCDYDENVRCDDARATSGDRIPSRQRIWSPRRPQFTLGCAFERLTAMLIPCPTMMTATEGDFELDETARITAPDGLAGVVARLQSALRPATGLRLGESADGSIHLVQ